MHKNQLPEDFPLIPKPVDVSPLTKAIVQDIVDRIADGEGEPSPEEDRLLRGLLLVFLELARQMEWRMAMLEWMRVLDDWLSDSPNIVRK